MYVCIATLSADDFTKLVDPSNQVLQLLQEHFMAIQTMIGPIVSQERCDRKSQLELLNPERVKKSTARWADGMCSYKPFAKYLAWPRGLQESARDGSLWKNVFEPSVPLDDASLEQHEQEAETFTLPKYLARSREVVKDTFNLDHHNGGPPMSKAQSDTAD